MESKYMKICKKAEQSKKLNPKMVNFDCETMIYNLKNSEADSKDIKIFSSICPHNGGPVNFTNGKLVCTWHNYSYDSATGVCNNNKSKIRLCKKDYVIDGDSIYLING